MNKPESEFLYVFLWIILIFPSFVLASTTNGTVDSTYKYVWGENAGWINFGTSDGDVHITDFAITGYAWSENYGWINLNPTGSGVLNNGNGDLSGNAWGENLGWIDFGNVSINSSGNFSGTAVISNDSSQISFNCANCSVKTDWRPASARTTSVVAGPVSSVGPAPTMFGLNLGSGAIFDGFTVKINNGVKETSSRNVNLSLYGGFDSKTMMISERADFSDAIREPYSTSTIFTLSPSDGEKIIYVKFYNQEGMTSPIVMTKINLKTEFVEIKQSSSNDKINKFTKSIFIGLKSNDVKDLQKFLKNQGADIYPEGLVTGYFGQLTKKAVQRFQIKENIVKNSKDPGYGYVGPKTRAKINLMLGY